MSISKGIIEHFLEYTIRGYIRQLTPFQNPPTTILHFILLYSYLFDVLSSIISTFLKDDQNQQDTVKILRKLRFILNNHHHPPQMHSWSEEVISAIS